jgi:hypothetical protein
MELIEIASYIFFFVFIMFVTPKAMWLIFFLFCFRFWESLLSWEFLSSHISFAVQRDYYIFIVILTIVTYFLVMLFTRGIPILRYVLLVVLVIYTIRIYNISDILVFKDHLESLGLLDLSYWKGQLDEMLSFSIEDFQNIFIGIGDKILSIVERFVGYVKGISFEKHMFIELKYHFIKKLR